MSEKTTTQDGEELLPLDRLLEEFTHKTANLGSGSGYVMLDIENTRFEIDDSVFPFLDKEWRLACKRYPLQTEGPQKAFGQIALLAQALQVAEEHHSAHVGVPEVLDGWRKMRVCGLGEHPHECLGESVFKQKDALIADEMLAGRVLRESLTALDLDLAARDFDNLV